MYGQRPSPPVSEHPQKQYSSSCPLRHWAPSLAFPQGFSSGHHDTPSSAVTVIPSYARGRQSSEVAWSGWA